MKNYERMRKKELIEELRKKEKPDMTQFKQHMEKFEILNTQLVHRSLELELTNSDLEAFNSTISHDLRTPLATIQMYTEAILKHYAGDLDEQCRAYLKSVFGQIEYMNELINRQLKFSQAAFKEIKKEKVDLGSIAQRIAANLKLNDPGRKADFKVKKKLEVKGDKCLLQEVLENLIGNAWKYTGMKESAVIEFGVMECGGKPACFVRDNGIGFDSSQAAKLFVPFQTLHSREEFKGHGIGLASVKRIIKRHGGQVWAEGKVGKGATFYFTLV
jgi:light-regulated signal transduction histidine kinase (bacteriophytochrome)